MPGCSHRRGLQGFEVMLMRSDMIKKGRERAGHRSLMRALGLADEDIARPLIGVAGSANELVPGHIHLDSVNRAAPGVEALWASPGWSRTVQLTDLSIVSREAD